MSFLIDKKILICIYTCKKDRDLMLELKSSEWYRNCQNNANVQFVDVYADESPNESFMANDNELIVKTQESYDNLCMKTYEMIKSCASLFDFDILIKLDASIISNKHVSVSPIFSFENFVNWFAAGSFLKNDYDGYCKIEGNCIESFRNWASNQGLFVLPEALFSDIGNDKWPDWYWGGKCYSLSRNSCEKILPYLNLFEKFKNLMGGCEDFCIACALKH